MTSDKPYYLTTPLYYVNAPPHLGHAYTTVIADVLARYRRLRGEPVFFLTGTDEHGQKIQQAAVAAGQLPQQFADATAPRFIELWKALYITHDDFIRTTEPRHTAGVQAALTQLLKAGQIAQGAYEGWYCTPCETFWPNLTIVSGMAPSCPDCHRPVEQIREQNYFFPLEPHRVWLRRYIQDHETFIVPATRRNEVLAFLEQPLQDLCISRPLSRLSWGIPMPSPPFEPGFVTYVWFDALLNYVTAVGFPKTDRRWPADVHLIGKDILRPHAVYWPIMLHALGLEPPRKIAVHGWWLVEGQKMSKSRGNVVDPNAVVAEYGVDAYRYFLLREVPFGQDGTFSEGAMERRYTDDLANDLGNLVYRTLTMIEKYCGGMIPPREATLGLLSGTLTTGVLAKAMDDYTFDIALGQLWGFIDEGNALIDREKPWVLAKDPAQGTRLRELLGALTDQLRALAVWLWPFMPTTSESLWAQLGYSDEVSGVRWDEAWAPGATRGQRVRKGSPLFPRRERGER